MISLCPANHDYTDDGAEIVDDGLDLGRTAHRTAKIEFVLAECGPDPERAKTVTMSESRASFPFMAPPMPQLLVREPRGSGA